MACFERSCISVLWPFALEMHLLFCWLYCEELFSKHTMTFPQFTKWHLRRWKSSFTIQFECTFIRAQSVDTWASLWHSNSSLYPESSFRCTNSIWMHFHWWSFRYCDHCETILNPMHLNPSRGVDVQMNCVANVFWTGSTVVCTLQGQW